LPQQFKTQYFYKWTHKKILLSSCAIVEWKIVYKGRETRKEKGFSELDQQLFRYVYMKKIWIIIIMIFVKKISILIQKNTKIKKNP